MVFLVIFSFTLINTTCIVRSVNNLNTILSLHIHLLLFNFKNENRKRKKITFILHTFILFRNKCDIHK